MTSPSMRTLHLLWPNNVEPSAVITGMRVLATAAGTPTIVRATGQAGVVTHYLTAAEGRVPNLTTQLRGAIPGLGIEGAKPEQTIYTHTVEIVVSTRHRALQFKEHESVARALIGALAKAGRDEVLSLDWILSERLAPMAVGSKVPMSTAGWWESLARAPFSPPPTIDGEARQALRSKRSEAGWRALGRIAVRASSDARARQLINGVYEALRITEGAGVHLSLKRLRSPNRYPRHARLRLNLLELASVAAWPTGRVNELPVVHLGSRRLRAADGVARSGRTLGTSTWPGRKRPLALNAQDATRHLALWGPPGTGKSNTCLHLALADIRDGRSLVVVEPSGDLIREILARVPRERLDDVVLIDPTDDHSAIGINPLAGPRETAELRADQLLGTLHSLYAANWGPRTSDILHAALLTLARTPGMSLPALPLLLSDARFRRHLIGDLDDPLGLAPFWSQYEAWSDAERATATAPVLNKLRPFLVRSRLRRIVGQAEPRFDLGDVFTKPRIVLINLARGELGPEAADLLGSLVLSGLWQHAQTRTRRSADDRPVVPIFLDEYPSYLHLPIDLGDALARGRALGLAFTLVAQHLGQPDPRMRAAVLANARSQLTFQLAPEDAKVFATTSPLLGAEDFQGLDRYHFYARLMGDGVVQPWCSGVTSPPPSRTIDPDGVRRRSRERYGVPAEEIDTQLRSLFEPAANGSRRGDDLSPRRRKGGA